MKILVFFFAILLFTGSCSKKTAAETDTVPPVITIDTPLSGQVYTAGQKINITGSVTDNKTIAEIHIHVTNVNTGALYLDVHLFPASGSTTFQNQDLSALASVSYKVELIAIDRSVNQSISDVYVSCN